MLLAERLFVRFPEDRTLAFLLPLTKIVMGGRIGVPEGARQTLCK